MPDPPRRLTALASALLLLHSAATPGVAQEPFRLRVLSYNINSGAGDDSRVDYDRITAAIRAAEPDVIALQEVDRGMVRTGNVDQARLLAGRLELEHAFGGNFEFLGGEFGNAVLSRFPIAEVSNHPLPSPDGGEPRGALEAILDPEDGPTFRLISTQLDHRRDERNRVAAAEWLASLADSPGASPAVLAGDLNAPPGSAPVDRLLERWTPLERGPLRTVPARGPRTQFDHILVAPAGRWRVVETRVLEQPDASDHLPVLAVLELVPASP
ncbi:endonuclease/exonuclease/phosphatase family protein [Tautonia plasticadhaerens]|uniref:Endonuclease/Exonuclease/phosphatase family protein n=1 Tax=Tautonia plasticadhaerens TaxID=2527974 RepID=A0A518HAJ2_9BACT|nr:endonuclease/exonuclease/phosphatase family protein [Tautonia plasticadhaerens]QDV37870.1 Endonuclease/Exonuclease/phosphatase family protein [Tautonia plasticadhaerens]